MIGGLEWPGVHAQALAVQRSGGPAVPPAATRLDQLAVMGPADILAVSRRVSAATGAAVMSSGGTTGRPKLTFVAHHQAIERLLRVWRPLSAGQVLLNLFTPGRLWASHYYMQTLAERSGCHVAPMGPLRPQEVPDWLDLLREIGVDALAGTPTALADFAEGVSLAGADLDIRTVIWMAEPWTPAKLDAVRAAFPNAGFWGNYGSVETFVIATNTPDCEISVLHLMPDQLLEPDDDGALLSRTGDGWTVPTVRYRLGDRVATARCRCGAPGALRVTGRADDAVKLGGSLFAIGEVLTQVRSHPLVTEAQLVLTRATGATHAASRMTVLFTGAADPAQIRDELVRSWYDLPAVLASYPEALTVRRVHELHRVDRTNKVPPAIWQNAADVTDQARG